MQYRPFGKTGLQVSEIGFGTWGIGGSWWGGKPDDEEALRALRRGIDLGINFFDTALVYGMGHSEQLVGKVLRSRKATTYLASKIPPKNHQWPARHGSPAK